MTGSDGSGRITIPDDRPRGDGAADPAEPPIEPGRPSAENVLFVLLGMAAALAVVFRLVQLFG